VLRAANPAYKLYGVEGITAEKMPGLNELVASRLGYWIRPGQHASLEDIQAHCRTRIAGYKVPRSVDFIAALPRNPSGKILKRELRKPYWADRERQVN